jgi:hypothetical protein
LPDNPRELSEVDNDAIKGADPIELKQEMFRRRGLLLASLAPKDVDYFRFDEPMIGYVSVVCEGESGGSGVRGLHAELRNEDDEMLIGADEALETNLLIDGFQVLEPGTYYLRLSSATKATKDAVEPWARCALIARP